MTERDREEREPYTSAFPQDFDDQLGDPVEVDEDRDTAEEADVDNAIGNSRVRIDGE